MRNQVARFVGIWLCTLWCGGCASLPAGHTADPGDPFERINRATFSFNDAVDRAAFKPLARAYRFVVPDLVQRGIANFFDNISDVPTALNALLQGEPGSAATHLGRFAFNTTVGLLGVFDVATEAGIDRQREDFGLTLGKWGIGSGPYIVLPFLGPSSVRDSVGLAADIALDPLTRVGDRNWRLGLYGVRIVEKRAAMLTFENTLDSIELDPYLFTRDAYLSRRSYKIHDGDPPTPNSSMSSPPGDSPLANRSTEQPGRNAP